ncbi:MAG TPA: VCBS repeat-containing protein, partial [Deltaproteobacteria bacterium]|nr:VCBS repeat-containing protein [Deltaproteobacteria bacterium]
MWWWTAVALAASWEDVTSAWLGSSQGWSNEVEIADLDGDGDLDVLFANGGGYDRAGSPEPNGIYLNDGAGVMTALPLGGPDLSRSLKVRDFDGDGDNDLFVAGAWETTSRLILGDGLGAFTEVSDVALPRSVHSVSDIAAGDVDGDGDLDVVLSDSGPGRAGAGPGAITRLWLNDGAGTFTDATDTQMPQIPVSWSWDLDLADLDGDLDLDLVISCKTCSGSLLFLNDGAGTFTDASTGLPQRSNNYEFEAMDLDGDGDLDLTTINDGPGSRNRVLRNEGAATFSDLTAQWWPDPENPPVDDNVIVYLDYDDDGDADFIVGSLFTGADRVMVNDGTGAVTQVTDAIDGGSTWGTLSLALGDLDGDGLLDLVMGQGESAFANKIYRGVDLPPDTHAPVIEAVGQLQQPVVQPAILRARVHDRKTPVMPHDAEVSWVWEDGAGASGALPLRHVGGQLWQVTLQGLPGGTLTTRVCATDRI